MLLLRVGLLRVAAGRRLSSTSGASAAALEYLRQKGYGEALGPAMLKALSPASSATVSVRELQAFGDAGLSSMAQAVQRELEAAKASANQPPVTLLFSAPHAGLADAVVHARHGTTLLDVARESPLVGERLECACNGIAACSTCHVILSPDQTHLFAPPSEAEQDMLDLAADLQPTSRLGCQLVLLADKHQSLRIAFPKSSNNLW